jgi:endonuclease G, mitochondrial
MRPHHTLVFLSVLLLGGCAKEEVPAPTPPVVEAPPPLHLTLGNPSGATSDGSQPNNHLVSRHQYALAYANSRGTARWVSWHLNSDWLGNAERCDCFLPDSTLPAGFFLAQTWDYSGTGFDRGHLCPSSDRDQNDADNAATFLLSNIMPQAPQLNQGIWAELEDYARTLVYQGYEVYTIAGGRGMGGTGSFGGTTTTLAGGAITVPARYWKVLLILPNDDADDIPRITPDTRVIAVDIPNTQAASALPWGDYRTSVDAIETATGLDLLSRVPGAIQAELEALVDNGPTE